MLVEKVLGDRDRDNPSNTFISKDGDKVTYGFFDFGNTNLSQGEISTKSEDEVGQIGFNRMYDAAEKNGISVEELNKVIKDKLVNLKSKLNNPKFIEALKNEANLIPNKKSESFDVDEIIKNINKRIEKIDQHISTPLSERLINDAVSELKEDDNRAKKRDDYKPWRLNEIEDIEKDPLTFLKNKVKENSPDSYFWVGNSLAEYKKAIEELESKQKTQQRPVAEVKAETPKPKTKTQQITDLRAKEQAEGKAEAPKAGSVGVVGDVYKNNPELSKTGTEQEYLDYIESVFPNSKIKDVVYHKTSSKEIEGGKFKISRLGGVYFSFFNVPSGGLLKGLVQKLIKENTIIAVVDVKNPFIVNRNNAKEVVKKIGLTTQDVTKLRKNFDLSTNDAVLGFPNEAKDTGQLDNFPTISFNEKDKKDIIELAVFDPEQIHILGSKSDIEGFKKWKQEQSLKEAPKPKAEKTSPLAPFSTKDKEGQAARAALKESVGPAEYKRLENIAKNGEKILRSLDGKVIKIDCP